MSLYEPPKCRICKRPLFANSSRAAGVCGQCVRLGRARWDGDDPKK